MMQSLSKDPLPPPLRFYLIGFMGSGKSYIGHQLGTKLNLNFQDLDNLIVSKTNRTITELFAQYGENHFRDLEKKVLFETQTFERSIIATGGGTPCFFDNMDWMKANGMTIYLDTAVPVLIERLRKDMQTRPLIASKSTEELEKFIENKLEERRIFYEKAHIVYHIKTGKEPVLLELETFLSRMIV